MPNLIKSGFAFNKLANVLDGMINIMNELEYNIRTDNVSEDDIRHDIYFLGYIGKVGIYDKIEMWGWNLMSLIVVRSMGKKRIPLMNALSRVFERLNDIAQKVNLSDEINEILDGGTLFYTFSKNLPGKIKRKFE